MRFVGISTHRSYARSRRTRLGDGRHNDHRGADICRWRCRGGGFLSALAAEVLCRWIGGGIDSDFLIAVSLATRIAEINLQRYLPERQTIPSSGEREKVFQCVIPIPVSNRKSAWLFWAGSSLLARSEITANILPCERLDPAQNISARISG